MSGDRHARRLAHAHVWRGGHGRVCGSAGDCHCVVWAWGYFSHIRASLGVLIVVASVYDHNRDRNRDRLPCADQRGRPRGVPAGSAEEKVDANVRNFFFHVSNVCVSVSVSMATDRTRHPVLHPRHIRVVHVNE